MSKPSNQQPYRLLQTLDVPTRPWETIGIDFVWYNILISKSHRGSFRSLDDNINVHVSKYGGLITIVVIAFVIPVEKRDLPGKNEKGVGGWR